MSYRTRLYRRRGDLQLSSLMLYACEGVLAGTLLFSGIAIGYLTPADKLAGQQEVIFQKRDQKLAAARELRRQRRADAVQTHDSQNHANNRPLSSQS